mmetsp:Transcript_9233/g.14910  ORF Transcript_9233/g.14910 Transcript_9233/m.14910 type:complete len:84 (-) Transcript_9233:173-424(-)
MYTRRRRLFPLSLPCFCHVQEGFLWQYIFDYFASVASCQIMIHVQFDLTTYMLWAEKSIKGETTKLFFDMNSFVDGDHPISLL